MPDQDPFKRFEPFIARGEAQRIAKIDSALIKASQIFPFSRNTPRIVIRQNQKSSPRKRGDLRRISLMPGAEPMRKNRSADRLHVFTPIYEPV